MDPKKVSRRTLLMGSSSLLALGLVAGVASADNRSPSYSVVVGSQVRSIATNMSDLSTEIGKLFPRILTGTDRDMLLALEKTAGDVFTTGNAIWAPPDYYPAVPFKDAISPFVAAVYAYLGALDALSNILNALLGNPITAVAITVSGLSLAVLRGIEAAFGIGRPVEGPAGLILSGARAYANTLSVGQGWSGLQTPVASRMTPS